MKSHQRILVFRLGQLGDTLVSVPALHLLREQFASADITLLYDEHEGNRFVHARAVLEGSGLVEAFLPYPAGRRVPLLALATRMRHMSFDRLVYLAPSLRTERQRRRDQAFFRLAGLRETLGFKGFLPTAPRDPDGRLSAMPFEADLLLQRLAADGIPIPNPGQGNPRLPVEQAAQARAEAWLATAALPQDAALLAVAAGSKMPAKCWPSERYVLVLKHLVENHRVWPIFFGGPDDQTLSEAIRDACGAGSIAAGSLTIPEGIHALSQCQAFLGNDSGVMHMAAAAGLPCVALFSARENPGNWYPYGTGHEVLRHWVECEGCFLTECIEEKMKCLSGLSVGDTLAACEKVLGHSGHA